MVTLKTEVTASYFLENFPGHVIQFFSDQKENNNLSQETSSQLNKTGNLLAETRPSLDANYASSKQAQGCGVYFSPNGFENGRRKTENLKHINSVFIDLDIAKEKDNLSIESINELKEVAIQEINRFSLPPQFIIETKNGLQVIWLVESFSKTGFDEVVKFLIDRFKADEGRKGVAGVLRLPGYLHLKNPNEPFLCRLLKYEPSLAKYEPSDFYNLDDFIEEDKELRPQSKLFAETPPEFNPSPEIKKAIEVPISEVLQKIGPMVGINIELSENADGSSQIIEDGIITSGFISNRGNYVESSSEKNRKGNPITLSKYYLNELGGNNYNAQQVAKMILTNYDPPDNQTKKDSEYTYITAGSLRKKNIPPARFIIDQILPYEGITMISGLPGSYKTWLYLHFASCIIKGLPVFGIYQTTPTNIMLINIDDSLREIQERLEMAQLGDGQDYKVTVWEKRSFKITKIEDQRELMSVIKKLDAKLVIVDTLRHSHDSNENESDVMNEVMTRFKEIIWGSGCAILLVHHNSKEYAGKNSITAPSGSVAIIANCISSLNLKRGEQDNQLIMEGGKNKVGAVIKKTILQFDKSVNGENMFRKIEVRVPKSTEELKKDILEIYSQNPNPKLTRDEFINEYRKSHQLTSKGSVEKVFSSLEKKGALNHRTGANNRKEFYLNEEHIELDEDNL